jgi:hypothetical protein
LSIIWTASQTTSPCLSLGPLLNPAKKSSDTEPCRNRRRWVNFQTDPLPRTIISRPLGVKGAFLSGSIRPSANH